jgi:hypothetical protein
MNIIKIMNVKKLHKLVIFSIVVINNSTIFGGINNDIQNEISRNNAQMLNGFNFGVIKKHGLKKISENNFNEVKGRFVQYLEDKGITITSHITSWEKTSHNFHKCVNYFFSCSGEKKCGIRFFDNGTIHVGEFAAKNNKKNGILKNLMSKVINCIDGWYAKKTDSGELSWYKIGESACLNIIKKKVNTMSKNVRGALSNVSNGISNTINMVNNTRRLINNTSKLIKDFEEGISNVQGINNTNNNIVNQGEEILNEEQHQQHQNMIPVQLKNILGNSKKPIGIQLGECIGNLGRELNSEKVQASIIRFKDAYEKTLGDYSTEEKIDSMTTGMKIYGICCRCKW